LRKFFQKIKNVYIRVTEVTGIELEKKRLQTQIGIVNYDYLVLAMGAQTNFFGNAKIASKAISMKSVSEALYLRNRILEDYERALTITDYEERQGYIDIVIVGGGPTGVEVAGALAEMRKYILPKDYPEMDVKEIDIHLIQSGDQLLKGMSKQSADKALKFLQALNVNVILNNRVTDIEGEMVYMNNGQPIRSRKIIWAAGIIGSIIKGLPEASILRGNRVLINEYCQVEGAGGNVFAIGDLACLQDEANPEGHPQVAQVAMQMGEYLGKYFRLKSKDKAVKPFRYKDLGSMATIGRNRAVVDLPKFHFQGFFAWLVWLFIHLYQLIGFRNKFIVFFNWIWSYLTYDQSLRLIIRPYVPEKMEEEPTANTVGNK
jgi:NADH dehydrogenase